MGQISPTFENWLYAPDSICGIQALSFWGCLLFVFYTGLHIEAKHFLGGRRFWILAFASLLVPCILGAIIAVILVETLGKDDLLGNR